MSEVIMASGYITSDGKDLDKRYLAIDAKAKNAETVDLANTINGSNVLGKIRCTSVALISVTLLPFTTPNDGCLYGDFVVSISGTTSTTAKLLVDGSVCFQKSITPESGHTYRNEFLFFISKG